jgi:predicted metal-binding membrane protein
MGGTNAAPPGLAERLLRHDRALLAGCLALLVALAAVYTVFGVGMEMSALQMTAMRGMSDMPGMRPPGQWSPTHWVLVFLMWWVMMVAMMVPSASPTVLLHSALLRRTSTARSVPTTAAAFLAGYLAAWAGFAALATSVQWGLESAGLVSATMMSLIDSVPGAVVLIAAGVFQFTPLKAACLRHCRSPADFITRRKRPGVGGAFAMGLEHGTYCLGCCWFLMALLFVGGIMNLYWIVGLAVFVAIEKLAPIGEAVGKIAGAVLILWGGYILASSALT